MFSDLLTWQCDVNIRDESGRSLASWARYGDQALTMSRSAITYGNLCFAGPGAPKGSVADQLFASAAHCWAAAPFRARSCSKAVLKMLYRHGFPPPVEVLGGAPLTCLATSCQAKVKLGQLPGPETTEGS